MKPTETESFSAPFLADGGGRLLKRKKVPMRMCVGCGAKRPKREMLRIVRTPEGEFTVDVTGRKNGRGCYICPNAECMEITCKQKKLAKGFEMSIGQDIYDKLKEEFKACLVQTGGGAVE